MPALALASPRLHTVTAIDIETLLQWVVVQDPSLGWRRDGERELAFDRGITAKPRKRPHVGWTEAVASAGGSLKIPPGRGAAMAKTQPDPDVLAIEAALNRLDPWTQSIITANAKKKRRPDWMEGVEPKLIEKRVYPKGRKKKRSKRTGKRYCSGTPTITMVWDIDPAAICATREIYARWHAGLVRLMTMVQGQLSSYRVNGLGAPAAPWEMDIKKTA